MICIATAPESVISSSSEDWTKFSVDVKSFFVPQQYMNIAKAYTRNNSIHGTSSNSCPALV